MNNEELTRIYNEAYGPVYWTAFQLLKNEADSEDIVQETFVSLIESYDTIKDKNKVTAWLKKNAANKCLNRLTRSKADAVEDEFFEDVEAMPEDFLPDTIVESEESRRVVMDIIEGALSDDVRRTLVLYYFDEMTTKEIAEAQGIPQGTVLWRLNFAKKKIKKEVEKYENKTNSKLYTMALPFLSKLFIAEAQQVPLRPIPPTLLDMTAAAAKSAASEAAKTAASSAARAAGKTAGITAGKVVAIGVASAAAVALIGGGIFLVSTHLLGNKPEEDEAAVQESEAEAAVETTVETTTTEPTVPTIEINGNEYLADYPAPGEGIMVYFKLAPEIDFYPDALDASGTQTVEEYYYNSINSDIGLAEVVCMVENGSKAQVIFTCNPVYGIDYYREHADTGMFDDGQSTITVSGPEICTNGFEIYTVDIVYEFGTTTFYVLDYQIDDENLFEIYTLGFNDAFEDPVYQSELASIIDYYRNVEDPILVVPDGTQVEIVGEAPMPEAAIETTVVQASADDPVTIAVEDIPELEQLKTFINYFPGEGYDCEEYPEWFSIGNMLPDSSMTEIIVDYGLYFPESYTEYSEDPLGIFKTYVGNSYRLDMNRLLWVEENILNMTEDNITSFNSGLYNTPDSYSEYYLADDGYIYYRKGSAGSGGSTIISEAMYDGQYYYIKTYLYDDMFYESDADYDPAEGPFYYYTMELKNIDGKDYWTVIRTSDVAPEVFG